MKILTLLLLIPSLASSQSRSSTNYSLIQETSKDTSGGASSSSDYSLLQSGAGAMTSYSANYFHFDGFIGQLVDASPVSLVITSNQHPVPEDDSVQFSARVLYDDGYTGPPVNANWNVSFGPFTVDPTGLVQTESVFEDTSARVNANVPGAAGIRNFTIANVLSDNYEEYSNDGLPDDWQITHFGLPPNLDAGPAENPDGDNGDNLFEYLTGYDPNDSLSALSFQITAIDSQVTFELSKMIPGTLYTIFESLDLGENDSWTATQPGTAVASQLPNLTNPENPTISVSSQGDSEKYYYLEVSEAP